MATLEIRTGAPAPNAIEVFCSYSHKDRPLREELDTHLQPLHAQGLINCWHDHAIPAGEDWESQIDERLNAAQIILLLVSADFMASEHCQIEMERALELRKMGKARVIPILLRHVDWHGSPLGRLQALPKDGRPVTNWPDRDQAFKDVTIGIRRVAEKLRDGHVRHPPDKPSEQIKPQPKSSEGVTKKYALIAAITLLALGGLGYFAWQGLEFKEKSELKRLRDKDWGHVIYNDPDLSHCLGVTDCVARGTQVARLRAVSDGDWAKVTFDSSLLSDCMGLPLCVARANQAARLRAKDWTKVRPGDPSLRDCMGYVPCEKALSRPAQVPATERPAGTLDPKIPSIFNQ
jgi:hypothetical protein